MGLGWQHLLIFAIVALILFGGRGKISELMGDFAKGIKAFKKGITEEEAKPEAEATPPKTLEHRADKAVTSEAAVAERKPV